MAWEDLEGEIAEEFSDNRRLGWIDSGFQFIRRAAPKPVRPIISRERYEQAKASKRAARRWAAFLQLKSGKRPHRCAGLNCHNLLPILVYGGGPRQRFCRERCRNSVHWTRIKQARRERKRIEDMLAGIRHSRCTGPECCNLLPLARGTRKPRLYCCAECGRMARKQRSKNGATAPPL